MSAPECGLLSGVFPVLPTPFDPAGQPDAAGLRRLVDYLVRAGVDGITYPGVASEVGNLTPAERTRLTTVVLEQVAGRVPVIVGASNPDPAVSIALGRAAPGASALMIAGPADRPEVAAQVAYFSEVAAALPGVPIMLQNVPPPAGAGLDPALVVDLLRAVPALRYVKEEALPSGQRLSLLRARGPASLAGVFGGAGGRYIVDELRRGALGTMPAIELAEVHVALLRAWRADDQARARLLFARMLPILNAQAVFRWALTKHVLRRRGLIAHDGQRAAGPRLDDLDRAEVDAFLAAAAELLLPDYPLA